MKLLVSIEATEIMKKTSTNIINVLGMASYSIRSASVAKEEELKVLMKSIVDKFNQKYEGLAKAEIEFEVHLLPFERVEEAFQRYYRKEQ